MGGTGRTTALHGLELQDGGGTTGVRELDGFRADATLDFYGALVQEFDVLLQFFDWGGGLEDRFSTVATAVDGLDFNGGVFLVDLQAGFFE